LDRQSSTHPAQEQRQRAGAPAASLRGALAALTPMATDTELSETGWRGVEPAFTVNTTSSTAGLACSAREISSEPSPASPPANRGKGRGAGGSGGGLLKGVRRRRQHQCRPPLPPQLHTHGASGRRRSRWDPKPRRASRTPLAVGARQGDDNKLPAEAPWRRRGEVRPPASLPFGDNEQAGATRLTSSSALAGLLPLLCTSMICGGGLPDLRWWWQGWLEHGSSGLHLYICVVRLGVGGVGPSPSIGSAGVGSWHHFRP
jgi:hypothetical protein